MAEVVADSGSARRRAEHLNAWALGALLLVVAMVRLFIVADSPLWLDETWTGTIVSERTAGGLLRQIYNDANAPLYYVVGWVWAQIAGVSDIALRAPARFFGAIAPLAALLPTKALSRETRFTWCALIALWPPGLPYTTEARCYTLLLLLSVWATAAFVTALRDPTTKNAFWWCSALCLCILTHYYAILLAAFQGVIFLIRHRERALAAWPAALILAPAAAWLAYHFPRMAEFADPQVAWQFLVTPARLPLIAWSFIGPLSLWFAIPVIVLASLATKGARSDDRISAATLAALAAALAAISLVLIGVFRPSFSERYLFPMAPGVLLGLAALVTRPERRYRLLPATLIAVFMIAAAQWALNSHRLARQFTWQAASEWLMRDRPSRLVFLWDNPSTSIQPSDILGQVGGFFFRRAGYTIETVGVPHSETDQNVALARYYDEHTAILWVYDLAVRRTAAKAHPPALSASCRDFGRLPIGIYACPPRSAP